LGVDGIDPLLGGAELKVLNIWFCPTVLNAKCSGTTRRRLLGMGDMELFIEIQIAATTQKEINKIENRLSLEETQTSLDETISESLSKTLGKDVIVKTKSASSTAEAKGKYDQSSMTLGQKARANLGTIFIMLGLFGMYYSLVFFFTIIIIIIINIIINIIILLFYYYFNFIKFLNSFK
jgi:hypothetical protein